MTVRNKQTVTPVAEKEENPSTEFSEEALSEVRVALQKELQEITEALENAEAEYESIVAKNAYPTAVAATAHHAISEILDYLQMAGAPITLLFLGSLAQSMIAEMYEQNGLNKRNAKKVADAGYTRVLAEMRKCKGEMESVDITDDGLRRIIAFHKEDRQCPTNQRAH